MREICIPIPHFGENQIASVEVTVNGKKKKYNFRVESFKWTERKNGDETIEHVKETTERIMNLKNSIESYDSGWELVQIYTPNENAEFIQVLFRQKFVE